jgi:hypothetical protein
MIKKTFTASCFFVFVFFLSNNLFAQANSDPASLPVYQTTVPITVDGNLTESDWTADAPRLMFRLNGTGSGNVFTPTNNAGLIVKPPYKDTSICYVRFLTNGMDLYVGLQSNDKYVCKFDWEGDGMFLKLKDGTNTDMEFHLYVKGDTTFGAETGGGNPAAADAYMGAGIVNGTIYDSTDVDNGYTAEMVIHLDKIGFTTMPSSLTLSLVIFDPDAIAYGAPWGPNGSFAKQWWGSEWGGADAGSYRTLDLMNSPLPVELTSFTALAASNSVELKWNTATEINNSGFAIERSSNNSSFSTIAFVKGHGTAMQANAYSYVDKNVSGKLYYRLKQVDFDGSFTYSKTVEVSSLSPVQFSLSQNYPNPFNPSTTISYSLPQDNFVSLKVYNVLGNEVATLVNEQITAGAHKVNFNASNLSSGVYYYTIRTGNFTSTKKLMLLK